MSSSIVTLTQSELKSLISSAVREALEAAVAPSTPQKAKKPSEAPDAPKKAKKEKDPNAPKREPNEWIKFTSRVRVLISKAIEGELDDKGVQKKAHPKAVTQTASAFSASMRQIATDEQILSAYQLWKLRPAPTPPLPASPVSPIVEASPPPALELPAQKKARKPMSEDAKKAAAAKRAATIAAKKAASTPSSPTNNPFDEEEIQDFSPFEVKGESYLKNARGDVMTQALEWVGHWDGKKINKKAQKPVDLEI